MIKLIEKNTGENNHNNYFYQNGYYELSIEEFNGHAFFEIYHIDEIYWNKKDFYMHELYVNDFYAYGEEVLYRKDIDIKIHFKWIEIEMSYGSDRKHCLEDIDKEIKGLEIAKNSMIEFTNFINSWNPQGI